ncbi:hypothetical protein O0I10_001382 [Lichtheimia ornata]|uniref:RNA helicase n=1 Tax=Lichtheimia ornata TaxID=688661 RepID=A0AAD7Y3N2_9FUNG|nr:uncharacterized protein O0I10_001382 [Lichtheimia ornata]KAJ8663205.1 hypothetical protein O0I10_001382 [Lichtheimia ornata]
MIEQYLCILQRTTCFVRQSTRHARVQWHARASLSTTSPVCRSLTQKHRGIPALTAARIRTQKPTLSWAKRVLQARLKAFRSNGMLQKKAAGMGIRGKLHKQLSSEFVAEALEGNVEGCNAKAVLEGYNPDEGIASIDRVLLTSFYNYAEPHLPEHIQESLRSLKQVSDLRFPAEWFPEARQMQRKIIMHVGPTNSGKTYHALRRLAEAKSGVYCGPLRLLAHEVFQKMNTGGVECNLLTGEEKRQVSPTAALTSSTIEMVNVHKPLEVAVIDEIQMIADPQRGWAWTQALLGLPAKEIHLCGEASAVPLVKDICEDLGDHVEVNEYKRLTPVNVVKYALNNDWTKIRKGDCVVTFSRGHIFDIKQKIELETGLKCAVVYGGLPPELRALQAQTFNDPESPVNVLVASDAIGMGLNLNIKRIVFATVQKFDGKAQRYITFPQLKQIGGRAGRFGTAYASGEITTLNPADLSYVQEAMNSPTQMLTSAGLQPTIDIIELFALQMPNDRFSTLLQRFQDLATVSGTYFLCNLDDTKVLADAIDHISLDLRDRYQLVMAPVPTRKPKCVATFQEMAQKFSQDESCELEQFVELPEKPPRTPEGLNDLENSHKIIMLYMWLSLRYPHIFTTAQEQGLELKEKCESLIDTSLQEQNTQKLLHAHHAAGNKRLPDNKHKAARRPRADNPNKKRRTSGKKHYDTKA